MTGNQYFQPVNLGGIATFTASGQTGWYQFDVPDALVSVLPGITVPADATGFVLQANTAIAYCFSPEEADLGTTAWLSLPAGGSVVVSGKQWVRQFCVRLGLVANASFTVQFLTGNIGPILEINAPVTGGIIPPPPPGLSAVPTPNVLHVMPAPTGNDATGAPYRLDLPYATIAAAEAAAQAGDTVMIWAGTYIAANLGGVPNVNFTLVGATIEDNGTDPVFNLNGTICTVDGFGLINAINGSPAAVTVVAGSEVLWRVPVIAGQDAVLNTGGTSLTIEANILGANNALDFQAGTNIVRGNAQGNVVSDGALCVVSMWGDITGMVTADGSSRINIQGNITGNVLADNSATITIRGTIIGSIDSDNSATVNQYGAVIGICNVKSGSSININGDVQGEIAADLGSVKLVGDIISPSLCIYAGNASTVSVYGNITSTGANGIVCEASTVNVIGNVRSVTTSLFCGYGGSIQLIGTAHASNAIGVYVNDGNMEVTGTVVSDADFGAQILAGTIRITGRIESCRACLAIEDSTASYTAILGAGTVLVAKVGGTCGAAATVVTLDSNPVNVISMGVFANLAFEPAVTALVQAPVVNVNVQ